MNFSKFEPWFAIPPNHFKPYESFMTPTINENGKVPHIMILWN
jgi:hypothetical protein